MTVNTLYQKSLISAKELKLPEVEMIFAAAAKFKKNKLGKNLQNKLIANCFFEPSTRTRLSFETSTLRLGGQVIGFTSEEEVSVKKGETLYDTMRVVSAYSDLIVIR